MKTYQEFQEAAALAIPAAARLAPYVLPAIGAAANLMKGAQPRKPAVQRAPDMSPAARQRRQRRQAIEDRKAQARERAQQNQTTGQGELGKKAEEILQKERQLAKDAEYAKQRRENPDLLKKEAKERRQAAMRERMRKAAEARGLD